MPSSSRRALAPLLVVLTTLLATPRAEAYLDPGTGSILLQSLVAAAAALAVGLRLYWRRLKSLFRGRGTPDAGEKAP